MWVRASVCSPPPPLLLAPYDEGDDGLPSWVGAGGTQKRRTTGTGIRSQAIWFVPTWLSQWQLLNCVRNVFEDASVSDASSLESYGSCLQSAMEVGKAPSQKCAVPSAVKLSLCILN
jgi:hypothetical protein